MRVLSQPNGYRMWLTKQDTMKWSHCAPWPDSRLAGKSVFVEVDANGICGFSVNGSEDKHSKVPANELEAMVADKLPAFLRVYWPTWEQSKGLGMQLQTICPSLGGESEL